MADIACGQCGHRNPAGGNFCSSCGAALEPAVQDRTMTLPPVEDPAAVADDDVQVALDDLPEGAAILVVRRGPGAGSRFLVDKDVVTAGRHPESDIFLDDVTVSRRHAEVARAGNGFVLRDVGSLNGTYLNRERIDEEAPLASGDELQVGRFKLVFVTA
jgi:pSer/pThr/pTyr-binding forkhead associated (FHA) protein